MMKFKLRGKEFTEAENDDYLHYVEEQRNINQRFLILSLCLMLVCSDRMLGEGSSPTFFTPCLPSSKNTSPRCLDPISHLPPFLTSYLLSPNYPVLPPICYLSVCVFCVCNLSHQQCHCVSRPNQTNGIFKTNRNLIQVHICYICMCCCLLIL